MKKLCIITPFFPPTGGPTVQRVYKHTKFLPSFGWSSVVITRGSSHFYAFDDTLLEEIPEDVKVYRTFSLDYGALKGYLRGGKVVVEDRRWTPETIKKFNIPNLIRRFLLIPDGYILWLPFALVRALRLVRKVDAYYLRVPVFSTGLLAPLLRLFTDKPIITDFSDEWTSRNIDFVLKPCWRRSIERGMEKAVLRASTWVAFSTRASKEYYSSRYPSMAYKFRAILNGYDEDDFTHIEIPKRLDKRLVIVYSGNCEDTLKPAGLTVTSYYFLKALSILKAREKGLESSLQVKFIGYAGKSTERYIREFVLGEIVSLHGNRPHRESIRQILSADLLLLILFSEGRGPRVIPAKLFEYLRARKPILALAPQDGEVARLIRRYNAGKIAHPESPEQIADAIAYFLKLHKSGELSRWRFSGEPVERFTRAESTRKLVEILAEEV